MRTAKIRRRHALWAAAAAASAGPTFAQSGPPPDAVTPQVVVTGRPIIEANRTDRFGSLATEVTDAQVKDLNALDLASALRRTPGVTITRFSAVGSFDGSEGGAVFVRGIGASRPGSEIKTYIDGIPFYTPTGNHPLLDLVPVHGMDRITVYKGPQPQTFGNTFAAIDLRPKRAVNEGLAADARIAGGSFATVVQQANLSLRRGDFDASLAQGHAESDGHRANGDGKVDNLLARAGLRFNAQWSAGVTLLHAENKVSDPGEEQDPDNTTNGRFHTRGTLAAVTLAHEHHAARGSLKLYNNTGMSKLFGAAPALEQPDRRSTFHLRGLRLREVLTPWAEGELLVGLDVDQIRGETTFPDFDLTLFDDLDFRLTSPYAALSHTFSTGGWDVTPSAGARGYRHNLFGNSTAPHAGIVAAKGDTLELRVNAARGINHPALDAPLVNFLVNAASPDPDAPILAPDAWRSLRPERMDHLEIGANWRWSSTGGLDVALFNDDFSGRYLFVTDPVPAIVNLGDYTVRGAELSWHQQFGRSISVFAGLTLLDPSITDLPYAPRRALSAGVLWQDGPWRVSFDLQAQSSTRVFGRNRIGGEPNMEEVPGFGIVNARASYALPVLGPRGEVFIALENLGDRRYAFRPGYPMPRLSGQVGLNFSL